jgi:hypothetical protein
MQSEAGAEMRRQQRICNTIKTQGIANCIAIMLDNGWKMQYLCTANRLQKQNK